MPTIRKRLDIPLNVLVTEPMKIALQRVAEENMISVSDIIRAAINAAVPVQFEKYSTYLAEEQEEQRRNKFMKSMMTGKESTYER